MSLREIRSTTLALAFLAFAGNALKATPVTVTEDGIGANDTVYINSSTLGNDLHVYAGIVDLTIANGALTSNVDSFCIDPWHWSVSGPTSDNLEPLASAPKPPGPMSAGAAIQIEQLWAQYMTSAYALSGNSQTADEWSAALQLEIWQTLAGSISGATYSLVSVDNNFSGEAIAVVGDLGTMNTFLSHTTSFTPRANLLAVSTGVSVTGLDNSGQDFVIPSVPDGGDTAVLTGLGLLGMLALGSRRLRASAARGFLSSRPANPRDAVQSFRRFASVTGGLTSP